MKQNGRETENAPRSRAGFHPTAMCESDQIGLGTRVWAHVHIMERAVVGADCNICDNVFIESGVHVADRVTIKNRALLFAGLAVANDVFIGPGVIFTNDRYPRSARMPEVSQRYADPSNWLEQTHVERGASIGAGAIVMCGTRIGSFATVGCAALVTRDVVAHALMVGQPAQQIGWVCACGVTLNRKLTCDACQRKYLCEDAVLRIVQEPDSELLGASSIEIEPVTWQRDSDAMRTLPQASGDLG